MKTNDKEYSVTRIELENIKIRLINTIEDGDPFFVEIVNEKSDDELNKMLNKTLYEIEILRSLNKDTKQLLENVKIIEAVLSLRDFNKNRLNVSDEVDEARNIRTRRSYTLG